MDLFIDTNVLLSFYHLTDEDIKQLHKLVDAIKDGTITLWTTSQLRDEFARNREGKIRDALKDFQSPGWKSKPPAFLRDYPQYKELTAALKKVGELHNDLMAAANKDAKERQLSADKLISELFEKAKCVQATDKIFGRAIERMRRGNPPGKDNVTIGDQISWEALLDEVPENHDLHIVSSDGDFVSPLYGSSPRYFLSYEWTQKKKSKLFTYDKLSSFFGKHLKNIQLVKEQERKAEIENLSQSTSFYTTHLTVAKLHQFEVFTPSEFEDLINIAATNSQVGWIIGDDDVKSFYTKLLDKLGDEIPAEQKTALEGLLSGD